MRRERQDDAGLLRAAISDLLHLGSEAQIRHCEVLRCFTSWILTLEIVYSQHQAHEITACHRL